ncbi:hypothetical protein FNV43_RR08080 [Rhamnella rubrinervis]|uniref:J domain-containing protein n=1 Tax=Rhamnella rubrinervis TaxID=2594499 RepID=A0A8K0MN19_9ROSA|nr:hypothetical protein FNV43_RR08080 [Rhamnella rubrinervis]
MANGEEKSNDFYAVLGLKKECSESDLRNAYKKLALRWHPDRCSSSGNSKYVEEAKKKFQTIQQAYSVLSDANKRFLYDVGIYDSDDDDENGMGDFLSEMAVMMNQTKSNENGEESFEELQELFEEMFQGDMESYGSSSQTTTSCFTSSSSYASYSESSSSSTNKRGSFEMNYGETNVMDSSGFDGHFQNFCLGGECQQGMGKAKGARGRIPAGRGAAAKGRRHGRKQKVSSGHDISSSDCSGISAA